MNIAKALKQKNRLVQSIQTQKEIISRENSRRNDNTSTIDVAKEYETLRKLVSELCALKAKISAASVPIVEKIVKLQEAKLLISHLKSLNTRNGPENVAYGQSTVVNYTWTAFITNERRDDEIKSLETQIQLLQDEVDEFNALTHI